MEKTLTYEQRLFVDKFIKHMVSVTDSYNKEDDCFDKQIVIETNIPNPRFYVLAYPNNDTHMSYLVQHTKDHKWQISDCNNDLMSTHAMGSRLIDWVSELAITNMVSNIYLEDE